MRKLLPVDVGQDTTHFLPHPGPQYTTELLQTILLARIRLAQENSLVSYYSFFGESDAVDVEYWENIRLVNYLSKLWKGCARNLTAQLVLSDLKAKFDFRCIFDYHDMVVEISPIEYPAKVIWAKTLLKWCVGRVEGIAESYDRLKSVSPRMIAFWHFWELWINDTYNGFDISRTVIGDSPEFLSAISSLATSYPHLPEARDKVFSKEEFLETVNVNLKKLESLNSKTIFQCIVERHHWLVRFSPSEIYSKPTIEHLRTNLGVVIPEITHRTQLARCPFNRKTILVEDLKQKRPRVQSKKRPPAQGEERIRVDGGSTLASSLRPSQSSCYRQFLSCARSMRSIQSQASSATSHSALPKKGVANTGLRSSQSLTDTLSTSLRFTKHSRAGRASGVERQTRSNPTWMVSVW